MVVVMFPDIVSHETRVATFQKILSMRVLEILVSLVGCQVYGLIQFEVRPTLRSSLFPIHRLDEIKNCHEPPARRWLARNFFFPISLSKKIYNKKI